ncbi:hypothetical protein Tco_0031574 [Tanacetum coccineum]
MEENCCILRCRYVLRGNRNGYQRRLNAPDNVLYWKLTRREVAKYEKNIKEAEVKADLQRRREGLAELPDDNQHLEENALINNQIKSYYRC